MVEAKGEIEFLEETGVVHLKASGQMDIETILEWSSDALTLAAEKSACIFLRDVRVMQPTVSTIGVYHLLTSLREWGFTRSMRAAMVLPKSSGDSTYVKFFEAIAKNAGYTIKLFVNPEDAWEWLVSIGRFPNKPAEYNI
jgi:hypothetical protein